MSNRCSRPCRRVDGKTVSAVLASLRALPFVETPSFAVSRNQIEVGRLHRDIFLAAVPGAYCEEKEVKHGGWQRHKAEFLFDGRGNPVIIAPQYLYSIDAAWELIREAAPGMGLTCEFLPGGALRIVAVLGPDGKHISADWPVFSPPHTLLIALFEYLTAVALTGKSPKPPVRRRAVKGA